MNTKRIALSFLALALLLVAVSQYATVRGQDENPEAATSDDADTLSLPDEVIGDAVADPWRMLDARVEPDPYTVPAPDTSELLEPSEADEVLAEDTVLADGVPVQGRIATSAGSPLNGSYDIRMALYTSASGGTAVCVDTDTVAVVDGLFTAILNSCTPEDISGQQLYLGIKVGTDPEMAPRQAVYGTPYAHSLRPNAVIDNTVSGHGLTVKSAGSGLANTSLVADNTNITSGVAFRAIARGNDASIVSSNAGTGALFKGFGGDGGEDEIRINNDGSLEVKADSYLWIPGNALVKNLSADTTRWDIQPNGAARIWRGGDTGIKTVYFPVVLPSVLYGQPVEVERITVYYVSQNGANSYITGTYLYRQTDADSSEVLISHGTDHKSTGAASYTLPLDNNEGLLSPSQGVLGLYLVLSFANDTDFLQVGGIRLQLGHHDLY